MESELIGIGRFDFLNIDAKWSAELLNDRTNRLNRQNIACRSGVSQDAEYNSVTSSIARQTGSASIFLLIIDWSMAFSQQMVFRDIEYHGKSKILSRNTKNYKEWSILWASLSENQYGLSEWSSLQHCLPHQLGHLQIKLWISYCNLMEYKWHSWRWH